MDRSRKPHVETLFERLHPGERHADARIRLAACEQFQQLVSRTGEVYHLDLQIVPLEDLFVIGDCDADIAHGICVPGDLQFPGLCTRSPYCGRARHTTDRAASQPIDAPRRRRHSRDWKGEPTGCSEHERAASLDRFARPIGGITHGRFPSCLFATRSDPWTTLS